MVGPVLFFKKLRCDGKRSGVPGIALFVVLNRVGKDIGAAYRIATPRTTPRRGAERTHRRSGSVRTRHLLRAGKQAGASLERPAALQGSAQTAVPSTAAQRGGQTGRVAYPVPAVEIRQQCRVVGKFVVEVGSRDLVHGFDAAPKIRQRQR